MSKHGNHGDKCECYKSHSADVECDCECHDSDPCDCYRYHEHGIACDCPCHEEEKTEGKGGCSCCGH